MYENVKLPLIGQKKKIELGTISGIDQYGYAYDRAKFGACIKNRTIHELCRRTSTLIDHRNYVLKCSKLKWNHAPYALGKLSILLLFFSF